MNSSSTASFFDRRLPWTVRAKPLSWFGFSVNRSSTALFSDQGVPWTVQARLRYQIGVFRRQCKQNHFPTNQGFLWTVRARLHFLMGFFREQFEHGFVARLRYQIGIFRRQCKQNHFPTNQGFPWTVRARLHFLMGFFREQFKHGLDYWKVFSVNNACKTDFLIGVFREQFNSSFEQEKALCSQDDAVLNQVLDVCTVVIWFDSIRPRRRGVQPRPRFVHRAPSWLKTKIQATPLS